MIGAVRTLASDWPRNAFDVRSCVQLAWLVLAMLRVVENMYRLA